MTRPRIMRVLAVALGLTLAFGTAAFAADTVVADGDLTDGIFADVSAGIPEPPEPATFQPTCPGSSTSLPVKLGVRRISTTLVGSFQSSSTVAFRALTNPAVTDPLYADTGYAGIGQPDRPHETDGAKEVPTDEGELAASVGSDSTVVLPSTWSGTTTPLGVYNDNLADGSIQLDVPPTAAPGGPFQGTALWRASGTKMVRPAPGVAPVPTASDEDGYQRVFWTVLDGDDKACDRAASATAHFVSSHLACGTTASLVVTPNDPDATITSEDGITLDIDWGAGVPDTADVHRTGIKGNDPLTFAAPYTAAGSHTATVSWTDERTNDTAFTGSTTASVVIDYDTSGILQPINANGSSIFKSVSTIPVKVRFMDCDGSVPSNLAPTITVVKTDGSTPVSGTEEAALSTSAHNDGVMRFSEGQWIYNLSGKSLSDPSATYRLTITVPATGQTVVVGFALKA